jgi:ribosomal protein S25
MTNLKDLNAIKMDKNLGKVIDSLANDPFGLSAAQVANNSKMSLKTVKNCLAVLLQERKISLDELGVYHTTQKVNEVDAAPVTQEATQLVVSAKTGEVMEVVKETIKANGPTPPAQSISAEGFDAKISPTNLLGIIPVAQPQAKQQPVKLDDQNKPLKVRILDFIHQQCLLSFNGVTSAEIAQKFEITKSQANNTCYALKNQGCIKSKGELDSKQYFYVQEIPRKRAEPRMDKTPKLANAAAASPFDGWIERQVIETQTVKLTEEQLEEVLKHVFNMDQVTFLTPLPDPYVVELKMEVVR